MIEIALCDDNAEDIEAIRSLAEQFATEHLEFPIRMSAFSSAAELLEHIENHGGFDLYIFDVMMPEMSGVQLAEIIRGSGAHAEIMFLTISRDYTLDAFSVRACGYLLKPICKEQFDETMLWTVQKLAREKNDVLAVKTRAGILRIPLHKIMMIESFNHTREITMTDGSVIETPMTLSELFERLGGYENFYMPHRAYIANLDNSVGIVRYDLLMLGDRRIPIPKNQFAAVQKVVENYFFRRK
ncbi:MAG: LytTR family DNA-binding domain-containing protein [Oscillospiraceae bacterium]|nr:LytTR family DNA-binding domain-containing protein [Oscillospiraceae bacterium]